MDEDSFQFMFNCSSDIDYGEDNADGMKTESDAAQQSSLAKKPFPIISAKESPIEFLKRQNNPEGPSTSARQNNNSQTPAPINQLKSCSLMLEVAQVLLQMRNADEVFVRWDYFEQTTSQTTGGKHLSVQPLCADTGEQADNDAADTPTVHHIEERHGDKMRDRPNVKWQLMEQSNFSRRDRDFWYEYSKSREDAGNLQRKFELQGWIEKKLRNVLKIDGINLAMYGSSVHSSAFKWSHLDLTIILPGEIEKDEEFSILEKFQLHFENEECISECKVLMGMRSILWLKLKGSNPSIHQLQKISGLQVDLSINNWSGIQSSALLYHYDSQNQLMGALSLLVKKWAIKKQLLEKKRPNEMLFSSDDPLIAIYIEDPINNANIANVQFDQIVEEFKETARKLDSSHFAIKDLFTI